MNVKREVVKPSSLLKTGKWINPPSGQPKGVFSVLQILNSQIFGRYTRNV